MLGADCPVLCTFIHVWVTLREARHHGRTVANCCRACCFCAVVLPPSALLGWVNAPAEIRVGDVCSHILLVFLRTLARRLVDRCFSLHVGL